MVAKIFCQDFEKISKKKQKQDKDKDKDKQIVTTGMKPKQKEVQMKLIEDLRLLQNQNIELMEKLRKIEEKKQSNETVVDNSNLSDIENANKTITEFVKPEDRTKLPQEIIYNNYDIANDNKINNNNNNDISSNLLPQEIIYNNYDIANDKNINNNNDISSNLIESSGIDKVNKKYEDNNNTCDEIQQNQESEQINGKINITTFKYTLNYNNYFLII